MKHIRFWVETIILIALMLLCIVLSVSTESWFMVLYFWGISVYAFNLAFDATFKETMAYYWLLIKSRLNDESSNRNQILDDIDFLPRDEPSTGGMVGPKNMTDDGTSYTFTSSNSIKNVNR